MEHQKALQRVKNKYYGLRQNTTTSYVTIQPNLYNVLYSINTQIYISTVTLYIHSVHITATCFNDKRSRLT